MRKRFLLIGFPVACLSSFLHAAGGRKSFAVYDYSKGVDTYHAPVTLPDGFVQDSLNVLVDDVSPVTKRFGYTVAWSTKAYAGQNLWNYTDSTNTTWQILRTSDTIIANNLTGTASVKISTVTSNNTVGEANAFGNAYFVDPTQGVYYWNGTSTTYVSGSPKGSIISQFHQRLWVSGAANPNQNQLYGSKYYDGTTWATGVNATDPVQYSIGLNDNYDKVSAEYVYIDTLYLFKNYSIFALYGFDQTNFQISQLTQECGCVDGNSIQTYMGGLKFVSLRGLENFDGYRCTRISDQIKNKIDSAINLASFVSNSWSLQTTPDFAAGTAFATYTDTISVNNSVTIMQLIDSFNSLSNWNTVIGTWTLLAGGGITPGEGPGNNEIQAPNKNFPAYWVMHSSFAVTVPQSVNDLLLDSSNNGYGVQISRRQTPNNAYILQLGRMDSGVFSFINASTTVVVTLGGATDAHYMDLIKTSTGSFSLSFDGVYVSSAQDTTYSSGTLPTILNSPRAATLNVYNYQIYTSTGYYTSPIHNTGPMTAFGNFSVTDVLNGGNILFSVCSSTNSNMGYPASCSSQTPNTQITVSTGTYVQWYATFTYTVKSQPPPLPPTLSVGTVQWFSGNRPNPMASTVWDNRYWLSITTTTADNANDEVMVLNSRGALTPFDIHAGGFTQYKNMLYHSDSFGTGNVYLDNQGYADNGIPINAYVKTKDISLGNLAADDYLYALYISAVNTGNCSMSVQYDMDHSGNLMSLGSPVLNEFATTAALRLPFPVDSSHQDFGQTINFKVGTNDAVCPWQFYGLTGINRERPLP